MEKYYQNPRTVIIGNDRITIEVKQLNHGIKPQLRNFFQNYSLDQDTGMFEGIEIPTGAIESLVIRRALVNMTHNNKPVVFESPEPVEDFPPVGMGDNEDEPELYEEVLKTVVDSNRFLARLYPFNMVFAQYKRLVDLDKEAYERKMAEKTGAEMDNPNQDATVNPTQSQEDTSTATRISGGDILQTKN